MKNIKPAFPTELNKAKSNLSASTAPTVNTDASLGYAKGSTWYNSTTGKFYVCLDNAVGAASWLALNGNSYKGAWAASTNTPTLANGTGVNGDFYISSDSGSVNFGAGSFAFTGGDYAIYNGAIWQKVEGGVSYTPEDAANKATSFATLNNILYPTTQAAYNEILSRINATASTSSLFVDPISGNDSTGDGSLSEPFLTVQAAINSFTAGSGYRTIYVNGDTSQNITFRSADVGMAIVLAPRTSHTGDIAFSGSNTNIRFLSEGGSAILSGDITDSSAGDIFFECAFEGTYTKTGGSGGPYPSGNVAFLANSDVGGMTANLSGNSYFTTLGRGSMGVLTQSNGVFVGRHDGTMLCPVISSAGSPALGQPITLFQGNIQLLKNGDNDSLKSTASYGIVFLAQVSTLQEDLQTLGLVNFTGSGANCFCYVWVEAQLATSGNTFPPSGALLQNLADYVSANRTPTNYTAADSSVKGNLSGIDTALGAPRTTKTILSADLYLTSSSASTQIVSSTSANRGIVAEESPVEGRYYEIVNVDSSYNFTFQSFEENVISTVFPDTTRRYKYNSVTGWIELIDGSLKDDAELGSNLPMVSITSNSFIVEDGTELELIALDANKKIESLPVATYPSLTEVSYLKGVTSSIQTQLTGITSKLLTGITTTATRALLVGTNTILAGFSMVNKIIADLALAWGASTTATVAGTTALTASSNRFQRFTGSTTQTVVMPDAGTLVVGDSWAIPNSSTGSLTVNFNGGSLAATVLPGFTAYLTLITASAGAGVWSVDILTSTSFGAFSAALTGKTTPVDADTLNIVDSAASNIMKKLTWANLKATLQAFFDTLYGENLVSNTKTNTATTTSSTYAAISGLNVTITPSALATGVMVNVTMQIGADNGARGNFRLYRDSTQICLGDAAGSRTRDSAVYYSPTGQSMGTVSIEFLDTPATGSPVTYSVQWSSPDAISAIFINRTGATTDSALFPRTASTITAREIK